MAELLDVFESFSTDVKPQFFDDDDVVSGEPLNRKSWFCPPRNNYDIHSIAK